jgi:hypothetical protein
MSSEEEPKPECNDCRYLDRYFGDVCRNETTHPPFGWVEGTWCHIEPRCEKKPGCGYEKTTPETKAWDDAVWEQHCDDANRDEYPFDCRTCKFFTDLDYPHCTYDYWVVNGRPVNVCWNTCLGRFYEKEND